jgi:predicted permease
MLRDARTAVRALSRAKGLTAVVLISLAIGTGANVSVINVAYGLLFGAPPGVTDPSRLLDIYTSRYDGATFGPSSFLDLQSIAAANAGLEAVAGLDDEATARVTQGANEAVARVGAVSPHFFQVLRIVPAQGRALDERDVNAEPKRAMLGVELWRTIGGGELAAGQTIDLDGESFSIVGILPSGFRGLRAGRPIDVWVPMDPSIASSSRGYRRLSAIARLGANARLEDVHRALGSLGEKLAKQFPDTNRGSGRNPEEARRLTAMPYSRLDPANRKQTAVVAIIITTALVLLLASACVNAGSLLLSRALARRREVAVKMALGASRGLLIRQFVAETVILTASAGVLGTVFAIWTLQVVPSLFAPEQASLLDIRLDVRAIAATIGIAVAAGLIFGLVPAVQGTAESPAMALTADTGQTSEQQGRSRVRAGLVIAQLALSVVLLVGATGLSSTLSAALEGDLGLTARNVAVFAVKTPGTTQNQIGSADALRDLNFVRSVAWASAPPLTRGAMRRFDIETGAGRGSVESVELNVNVVSPNYFRTVWLAVIEGRGFNANDHGLADPVVLVDEETTRRYFGGTPIGRFLRDAQGRRQEIVGVVRSGRYRTLQESVPPTIYYPTSQEYLARGYIVVRTDADPTPVLESLRRRLTLAGMAIEQASTLEARLLETLALDRVVTRLVGACGVLALTMATLGVYGVINDAVRRRTREIGVRIALGAGPVQVAKLVLLEALLLAMVGIGAGMAAAAVVGRAAASLISDLPSFTAGAAIGAPSMLVVVVVAAAAVPLVRALRVSPSTALRAQ